jgi:hypothetical protein
MLSTSTNRCQHCLAPAAPISNAYHGRLDDNTHAISERHSQHGNMNRLEALVAVATRDEAISTGR